MNALKAQQATVDLIDRAHYITYVEMYALKLLPLIWGTLDVLLAAVLLLDTWLKHSLTYTLMRQEIEI